MKLFQVYFISAQDKLTGKEQTFFTQIQDALYNAYSKVETGLSTDDWNNYFRRYVTVSEMKQVIRNFNQMPPSVCFMYRNAENEKFTPVLLKGIGSKTAWEKQFVELFNKVPVENRTEVTETDVTPDGENTDGKGGSNGNGTGNGLGVRDCNFLDEFLDSVGFGKIKKYVYATGAAYLGYKALNSTTKGGQFSNGALSAVLAYFALSETSCNPKKKV